MGKPINTVAKLQATYGAVLVSPVMYAVVGVVVVSTKAVTPTIPPEASSSIGIAFIVGGLLAIAASMLVRFALTARLPREGATLEQRAPVVLVPIAVAEVAGLLGLVYAILSGTFVIPCVLWVCSLGAGVFHFPRRRWLEGNRR